MEDNVNGYTTGKGVWNGWHYRFIGLTAIALVVLQLILYHYVPTWFDLISSLPLTSVVAAYVVIPRVKERRLGNAIATVTVTWVLGVILAAVVELPAKASALRLQHKPFPTVPLIEQDIFALVIGLVMSFFYLRLTEWSERKRAEINAKRTEKTPTSSQTKPTLKRHHRKVKRRK